MRPLVGVGRHWPSMRCKGLGYELFKEPDIVREIKARRIRLLGHLFRTDGQHICRKLSFTKHFNTRRGGRPANRC